MASPLRSLIPVVALAAAALAQEPLTVLEALSLKQVVNPKVGDGFIAFQVVVPAPLRRSKACWCCRSATKKDGAIPW